MLPKVHSVLHFLEPISDDVLNPLSIKAAKSPTKVKQLYFSSSQNFRKHENLKSSKSFGVSFFSNSFLKSVDSFVLKNFSSSFCGNCIDATMHQNFIAEKTIATHHVLNPFHSRTRCAPLTQELGTLPPSVKIGSFFTPLASNYSLDTDSRSIVETSNNILLCMRRKLCLRLYTLWKLWLHSGVLWSLRRASWIWTSIL